MTSSPAEQLVGMPRFSPCGLSSFSGLDPASSQHSGLSFPKVWCLGFQALSQNLHFHLTSHAQQSLRSTVVKYKPRQFILTNLSRIPIALAHTALSSVLLLTSLRPPGDRCAAPLTYRVCRGPTCISVLRVAPT